MVSNVFAGGYRTGDMINVLFVCTANSARSVLAEAILNKLGSGRFRAFSAGSQPHGSPHALALELLKSKGYSTGALRSKSWNEFARADARPLDLVITVCDVAAAEICPKWPGSPITIHWSIANPAGATGGIASTRAAFRRTYDDLEIKLRALVELRVETMDQNDLAIALKTIAGP